MTLVQIDTPEEMRGRINAVTRCSQAPSNSSAISAPA
jgi:hypothetical protein